MAKQKHYFQIADGVGIDPGGNPEPAVEVGIALAVPTVVDGELVNLEQRVSVSPIKDSRIFVTDDPLVADGLRGIPTLVEIDEPNKAAISSSVKETQASREAAGTHVTAEETAAADAAAAAVAATANPNPEA